MKLGMKYRLVKTNTIATIVFIAENGIGIRTDDNRQFIVKPYELELVENRAWSFQWQGGGYNSVFAASREEALAMAKELGKPTSYRGGYTKGLIVREDTLTDNPSQLAALDKQYSGILD